LPKANHANGAIPQTSGRHASKSLRGSTNVLENIDLSTLLDDFLLTEDMDNCNKKASKRKSKLEAEVDLFVASNVDDILLDCLEDELPLVTFDDDLPGSKPLDLIMGFANTSAQAKDSHFGAKFVSPGPTKRSFTRSKKVRMRIYFPAIMKNAEDDYSLE